MGNRTSENVVSVEDVTKVLDEMFVVGEEALPHHRDKFQKAIEQYQQHKATVVEILGQFFPEIRGSQDTNKLQAFIEAI